MKAVTSVRLSVLSAVLASSLLAVSGAPSIAQARAGLKPPKLKIAESLANDVSRPMRELARRGGPHDASQEPADVRPDRGPQVDDKGHRGDGALGKGPQAAPPSIPGATILPPLLTFEGLRNTDNPFLVAPPDPVGDVGPNHYVEMVNLVFAAYDKQGNLLAGPTPLGALWEGFAVPDCTDLSGDPIVIYDQLADRWLLSQFTTRGPEYFNCVAVSQTGDPTGAYYRYAFSAGEFFPDYPKYGVWSNSYLLTTRDFGPTVEYGISVYALERNKMINGESKVRVVQFFLDSAEVPLSLIGDGLLPPDVDGTRRPIDHDPAPIIGTMDDDYVYGAAFDALNIWELSVKWKNTPDASLTLAAQLPVAPFDSVFPCGPTSRDCIPQPGVTERTRFLDILSYRQRPTWRLAYRNFGKYEALVTNQSVEARPGLAGVRWYEIRRENGQYSVFQQGTYAPDDGVHRWMGSAAMDKLGNIALGYSVSNATTVFPGIRYTGRLAADPLGEMPLGEGVIINGSGAQLTTGSRWGDYTSMNVDPIDDCTFWYVNEYIETTGLAFWQTRVGSLRLPGCQ